MSTLSLGMSAALLGYIGPGGGIALLGPLLGVLAAAGGALLMVVIWPVRMLLKKRKAGKCATSERRPVG